MTRFNIEPTSIGARGQNFRVLMDGKVLIERTTKAGYDACRALLELGLTGPAEMWSGDKHLMTFPSIEKASLLTVSEGDKHGPRVTKFVAFDLGTPAHD